MAALNFNWFGRLGTRRRAAQTMPIRDLPLPRSPEPMPDAALVFAQGAARTPLRLVESGERNEAPSAMPASIATGADLRAMLERFEQSHRRRQALSQAADARSRLVGQLSAGKAGAVQPSLRLVAAQDALVAAEDERRIDRAMDEALESALGTLKRLSNLARD